MRVASNPVTDFSGAGIVLGDLADTLHEFQRGHGFGRGIAAIQIGVPIRAVYVEIYGMRYEILNPRISWRSEEKFQLWDDCFSFPNLMVEVERHYAITVEYQDRQGTTRSLRAEADFSELLQHEIDHLDGILAIDRALDRRNSFMTRREYLRSRASTNLKLS